MAELQDKIEADGDDHDCIGWGPKFGGAQVLLVFDITKTSSGVEVYTNDVRGSEYINKILPKCILSMPHTK